MAVEGAGVPARILYVYTIANLDGWMGRLDSARCCALCCMMSQPQPTMGRFADIALTRAAFQRNKFNAGTTRDCALFLVGCLLSISKTRTTMHYIIGLFRLILRFFVRLNDPLNVIICFYIIVDQPKSSSVR